MIRLRLETLLVALAVALGAGLLAEELPRMLFPWDLRMFSESVLLTDMLKLTAGQSPHTTPADCNSFVNPPGLDYLTYALLRPLGAQLDVRACRAVTVLCGVLAAIVTGRLAARFAAQLGGTAVSRASTVVASVIAGGFIFKSYTADACHPDNLRLLHAVLLAALTCAAVTSRRLDLALVAAAVGGLGIAIAQTGALGVVGALVALVIVCGPLWGPARTALVVACGLGSCALAGYVTSRGWGSFWTLTVPDHFPLEWYRRYRILWQYGQVPHRLVLALAFAPCALYLATRTRRDEALRRMTLVWVTVGAAEVLPGIVAYARAWTDWSELTVLDLWMAMPVVAVLWIAARPGDDGEAVLARRALGAGTLVSLLVALGPTRVVPTHGEYAFGRALDAAIAEDAASGRRVLVSHGASALVHGGLLDVPLDRSWSGDQLGLARLGGDATRERLAQRRYDKVYLLLDPAPQYWPDVQAVLETNYHEVARIQGDETPGLPWDLAAYQGAMRGGARVLEANAR
ncbi:MAG TPA: hypothetical protein VIF15_22150 [Polyangiaceae bacterium]